MRKHTQAFNTRQVMSRAGFEVFHYHDPEIDEIPIHHHDFFEIYFFLGGKVDYFIEGRTYELIPGDLLLIDPMELHRPLVGPCGSYERIVLWIEKNYLTSLSDPGTDLCRCFYTGCNRFHASHTDIGNKLRLLSQEFSSAEYGSGVYCQGLLQQILVELNRLVLRSEEDGAVPEIDPLVSQVLSYIRTHYQESLSLDELAAFFYVSKYHLSHVFSRAIGISVYRYILLKRLQMARELLSEGNAPGAVCRSCGFQDYANFYRAFKKQYGETPQNVMRQPQRSASAMPECTCQSPRSGRRLE